MALKISSMMNGRVLARFRGWIVVQLLEAGALQKISLVCLRGSLKVLAAQASIGRVHRCGFKSMNGKPRLSTAM